MSGKTLFNVWIVVLVVVFLTYLHVTCAGSAPLVGVDPIALW